jgi:hypothetical protein
MKFQNVTPFPVSHLQRHGVTARRNITSVNPSLHGRAVTSPSRPPGRHRKSNIEETSSCPTEIKLNLQFKLTVSWLEKQLTHRKLKRELQKHCKRNTNCNLRDSCI